jgi:hypothetical protein
MIEFEIPKNNIVSFQSKMEDLLKKARKLNLPEIYWPTYQIGESFIKKFKTTDCFDEDIEMIVECFKVTVAGKIPKLNGWQFVASVDYEEENANPVIKNISNFEIPIRYRSFGPNCEHCQIDRKRKNAYIVYNEEENKFLQAGSSCLKDFLGHQSPEHIANFCSELRELFSGEFEERSEKSYCYGPTPEYYLSWVIATIRDLGWISRAKSNITYEPSTADVTLERIYAYFHSLKNGESCKFTKPTKEDKEKAKLIIEWIHNLPNEKQKLSDYEFNLHSACSRFEIGKNEGIIASAVSYWCKIKDQDLLNIKSEYVGVIKDKISVNVTVHKVIPKTSSYGGFLILMHDDHGNIYLWSTQHAMELGSKYVVTGRVKNHQFYENKIKQTVLTHCKFVQVKFEVENE